MIRRKKKERFMPFLLYMIIDLALYISSVSSKKRCILLLLRRLSLTLHDSFTHFVLIILTTDILFLLLRLLSPFTFLRSTFLFFLLSLSLSLSLFFVFLSLYPVQLVDVARWCVSYQSP